MKKKLFYTLLCILFLQACTKNHPQRQQKESIIPVREDIEWLDVWLPDTNEKGLPRVLLIGNSITRAYYPEVETLLKGKAFVGRLSTSKSIGDPALLDEISLILKYDHFDLIHFNNGLHGWGYTEEEYKKAFPGFIHTIEKGAPDATLIWATTSPIRQGENMMGLHELTQRVVERNNIAREHLNGKNIIVNDLYGLVINHPEYYAGGDGTHLVNEGVTAMAEQVAVIIENNLLKK